METRTYTERSNARRAARAAGLSDSAIFETEDGYEVRFTPREDRAIEQPSQDDGLEIPEFLKIPAEDRKAAWERNPPKATPAQPRESITMAKTKAKKPKGASGADKTATLIKMLGGKGATVEQLTEALGWLPHTLRARISRLPKEDKKIKIERQRVEGVTTYRIA